MFCCQCQRDLSECICPDLEERMNRLRGNPYIHTPSIVDKTLAQRAVNEDRQRNRPDEKPQEN